MDSARPSRRRACLRFAQTATLPMNTAGLFHTQNVCFTSRIPDVSLINSFGSPLRGSPKEPKPIVQGLPLFVCMRFQDLFHSPPGVLFAFPSRYWFTIGRSRVFSLGGWSPHLQTGFLVSRPTCRTLRPAIFLSRTGLSPCVAALSSTFR